MIRLAICDDEIEYQNLINKKILSILKEEKQEIQIEIFSSGQELISAVSDKQFEIVLLDIDMPAVSGLNVADVIVEYMPRVNVIFITNRDDLVFEALKCNPYRFIRKSHLDDELFEAITSVIEKINKDDYVFVFGNNKQALSLAVSEICYLESDKHYINIYTDTNMHRLRLKLSVCEEIIKGYGFIKIHHSIIVNVRKIKKITSKQVTLFDDKVLPVSRSNSERIKWEYSEMIERYVDGIIV